MQEQSYTYVQSHKHLKRTFAAMELCYPSHMAGFTSCKGTEAQVLRATADAGELYMLALGIVNGCSRRPRCRQQR